MKKVYKDYMEVVGKPLYNYNLSISGDRPEWNEAAYRRIVKTKPESLDDVEVEALECGYDDRDIKDGMVEDHDQVHPEKNDIYNALSFRAFNKSKTY